VRLKNVTAVVSAAFADGGKGSIDLAQVVVDEMNKEEINYKPLYQPADSIENKLILSQKKFMVPAL